MIYFKKEKYNISYLNENFEENFMDICFEIPEKIDLKTRILGKNMNDKQILEELKPKESNLGEFVYALENNILSKNGYANIFYIRDKDNVLWAVDARWDSDYGCWYVIARSVEYPDDWDAGVQLLSRDFNFENSEPCEPCETLKLRDFESVKIIEIEFNGNKYKLVN